MSPARRNARRDFDPQQDIEAWLRLKAAKERALADAAAARGDTPKPPNPAAIYTRGPGRSK